MNLTIDGYSLAPDYAETMAKAAKLCDQAAHERRGREIGRRLADREIALYQEQIKLAVGLLSDAKRMIERGTFEEHEMAALEIGIELLQGAGK